MVMQRRHQKHAPSGAFEPKHLDDDGNGFHHEKPAHNREYNFMLGRDREPAKRATKGKRTRITHEYRRRRRVEPQESKCGADQRRAEHCKLTRAGHVV